MRGAWLLAALLCASRVHAHALGFGLVRVEERRGGEVTVFTRVSGTEQRGNVIALRPLPTCVTLREETETRGEERVQRLRWRCERPLLGATLTLQGLEGAGVQVVLRAGLRDGEVVEALLDDVRRTVVLREHRAPAARYLALGVRHIAEGADHLAYVLCLALWIRTPRALLAAVTGFTFGHSVTLALATLGVLRVPQRPVEACIALSVALLAAELAQGRAPPRRPALLNAAVGLLHGLGFASALSETGLPQRGRAMALVAFNVGVELGQLGFLAVALAAGWAIHRAAGTTPRARRMLIEGIGVWAAMLVWRRILG